MRNCENTAMFVIPHFAAEGDKLSLPCLEKTIEGLFNQSDNNWRAIIVDDNSEDEFTRSSLVQMKKKYYPKIDVIFVQENMGPGICRNIGIFYAQKNKSSIVLFNDADDVSHEDRLGTVRDILETDVSIGLVYSSFVVINTEGETLAKEAVPVHIQEILNNHIPKPVEGDGAWIEMATKTGYINKTSATSVRTKLIVNCLFPPEYASEDYHTWLRLSAYGVKFKFSSTIPSSYRIPSCATQQASRLRVGVHKFNEVKVRVDADGFEKAIEIALSRGALLPEEVSLLKYNFFKRQADSMKNFGEKALSELMLRKASLHLKLHEYYNSERILLI